MELVEYITEEVREQFIFIHDEHFSHLTREAFIHKLFTEMDEDGSGFIDDDELRRLFKKMQLTFSNYRFKLLYRAMDSTDQGQISEKDLQDFIFPNEDANQNSTLPAFLRNKASGSSPGVISPLGGRSRTTSEDEEAIVSPHRAATTPATGNAPLDSVTSITANMSNASALLLNRRKRFSTIKLQHDLHHHALHGDTAALLAAAHHSPAAAVLPEANYVHRNSIPHPSEMLAIREEDDEKEDDDEDDDDESEDSEGGSGRMSRKLSRLRSSSTTMKVIREEDEEEDEEDDNKNNNSNIIRKLPESSPVREFSQHRASHLSKPSSHALHSEEEDCLIHDLDNE